MLGPTMLSLSNGETMSKEQGEHSSYRNVNVGLKIPLKRASCVSSYCQLRGSKGIVSQLAQGWLMEHQRHFRVSTGRVSSSHMPDLTLRAAAGGYR